MKYNRQLTERIAEVAEVAGYLWQKGWAERNGGNISYNVTDVADDALRALPPLGEPVALARPVENLCGHFFLVTAPTAACGTSAPRRWTTWRSSASPTTAAAMRS